MGSQCCKKIELIQKSHRVTSVKFKTIRKVKFDKAAYFKKRNAKISSDIVLKQKQALEKRNAYAKNEMLR